MDTSLKFIPKQVLYMTVKTLQPLSPAVSCLPKDKEVWWSKHLNLRHICSASDWQETLKSEEAFVNEMSNIYFEMSAYEKSTTLLSSHLSLELFQPFWLYFLYFNEITLDINSCTPDSLSSSSQREHKRWLAMKKHAYRIRMGIVVGSRWYVTRIYLIYIACCFGCKEQEKQEQNPSI